MTITIAVLQERSVPGDVSANLATVRTHAIHAREQGAQLLITPEMFVTGYNIDADFDALVDGIDSQVAQLAADTGIAIAAGVPARHRGAIANAVILVDADGYERARYLKSHLFGDLDRGLFIPGDELPRSPNSGASPSGSSSVTTSSFPRQCGPRHWPEPI